MSQNTIQVRPDLIYFVPLIVLSGITGLVLSGITGLICFAIPRLRRYAFQAAIAPFAFAVYSIVGMTIIYFIANQFDLLLGPPKRLTVFATYIIPGLIGAGLAVRATGCRGLAFAVEMCTVFGLLACGALILFTLFTD